MEYLPADAIEHICEQMDLKTLNRFMSTNSTMRSVCSNVFTNKKKEDIQKLVGQYKFRDPDIQHLYNLIIKHAEPNNELYKVSYNRKSFGRSVIHKLDIATSNLYVRGNFFRAVLAVQKLLFKKAKLNYLNEVFDPALSLGVFNDQLSDEIGEVRNDPRLYDNYTIEEVRKDPKLYNKYLDICLEVLENASIDNINDISIVHTEGPEYI